MMESLESSRAPTPAHTQDTARPYFALARRLQRPVSPRLARQSILPQSPCVLELATGSMEIDDQEEAPWFQAPPADPTVVAGTRELFRRQSVITAVGEVNDTGEKIRDFDLSELKLYKCTYKLGPIEAPRLIKKGNPVSDYEFISSFRHPAAVQVENYFKNQCLVISVVDGTFAKWLASKEKEHLFTEQGRMLPLLRGMMIDLASLVEKLIANRKVPTELTLKNVYIRILPDGTPKLQVLVNEVTGSTEDLKGGAWKAARDIFDYCFTSHGLVQDDVTKSFCSFIGTPSKNIQRLLEDFPDQWDNSRKSTFLMESCAHVDEVRSRINFKSGLAWPLTSQLLNDLIYYSEEKASPYKRKFPYDYVRLGRNGFKHFDELPPWLKNQLGGNRDGLLRQIEQWSPNIWCKLYVAINSPKLGGTASC